MSLSLLTLLGEETSMVAAASGGAGSLVGMLLVYLVHYIRTRDEKKDAEDFKTLTTDLSHSIDKLQSVLNSISGVLKESAKDQKAISDMQKDLWEWHNIHDEDGVKRWYRPRGLTDSIKELSTNIMIQTRILEKIGDRFGIQEEKVNLLLADKINNKNL